MNNILIVSIVFQEIDIIKKSFNSIYNSDFDYFIIENKSNNSDEISKYFLNNNFNNIVGYICFNENISATAVNVFLRDFHSLIKQYEYLIITDGDFYIYDIKDLINENIKAFNNTNCYISSTSLFLENNYTNNKNRIIGIDNYIKKQKLRNHINHSHKIGITSACFLTFKTSNIEFLKQIHFIDTNIHKKVNQIGGIWLVSQKNQTYHLTWDLYVEGNPYYEWKKQVINDIWKPKPECDYIKYI